jgi:hypothetical protein
MHHQKWWIKSEGKNPSPMISLNIYGHMHYLEANKDSTPILHEKG